MRGFYRMCGALLLGGLPGVLYAQAACVDQRQTVRQYSDQILDDGSLHADAGNVDLQAYGVSHLSDGVRLRFNQDLLLADDVYYDQPTRKLRVDGRTFFETPQIQVQAQEAEIELDQRTAKFGDAQFITFAAGARGVAKNLSVTGPGQAHLQDVRYTTCPADAEAWVLQADDIRLDNDRGMGSARNARLRFMGVPLFWLPLFYFPVGDQRQTGFLPPSIGDSGTTGFDVSVPFYINLAPNYDLTLIPRYMAERGEQITGRTRYLSTSTEGSSRVEYLSQDSQTDQRRYLLATNLEGGTGGDWTWQVEYLKVSDIAYLAELDSPVANRAQSQLPQALNVGYRNFDYGVSAAIGVQDYQSLLASNLPEDQAYARLPELRLRWQPTYRNARIRPLLALNTVNFVREDSTDAWRHDAVTGLDWRYDIPEAFAIAHADYRWTTYQLNPVGEPESLIHRGLPTFQTRMGLRFTRPGEPGHHQTLTPQINYLFVPYREQSDIPVFDTSQPDFSFDQLFAFNRFTGLDRVADANMLTTAVQTDWFSDYGRTRQLSAKLGVQWRLDASQVVLPGETPQATGSSDWLGELDYAITEHWIAQMIGQWNADENQMDQGMVAARYQRSEKKFAQLSYRYRRGNFEQTDLLASLPVYGAWNIAGRWTYSLEEHRSLEALGGIEYRSCCWAVQGAWRRYLNGDSDGGTFNSSFYIQLELNGLGKIGEGLDHLLDRDIL